MRVTNPNNFFNSDDPDSKVGAWDKTRPIEMLLHEKVALAHENVWRAYDFVSKNKIPRVKICDVIGG
ncbi:MAG: hypothetical protein ACWGQW_17995 [bacterium]